MDPNQHPNVCGTLLTPFFLSAQVGKKAQHEVGSYIAQSGKEYHINHLQIMLILFF